MSFKTIEDFWAAMNWTQPPSKLGINCDYAVFKVTSYGRIFLILFSDSAEFRKEPSPTGRTGTTAWEGGGSLRGPRWRISTCSGWKGKNESKLSRFQVDFYFLVCSS